MQAYTEGKGPFSVSSVRTWVNAEETAGVAALRGNRELCGARSKFSPGKQATLDELMEKTEGEPTQREMQAALGVGSKRTALRYCGKAGYVRQEKRLRSLLSPTHMKERILYCDQHFDSDHEDAAHADEKMFTLGKGRKFRYVRHDTDEPAYQFVENQLHPPQLMVTAVVARPKGRFDGCISLFRSGGYEYTAKRDSKHHKKGDIYVRDDTVDGLTYEKKLVEVAFLAIRKQKTAYAFQDDNAKPHQKAWEKLGLKKAGICKKPHIIRQQQPAKSPDLNVCDLYVWGVLQAGVNMRRPKTLDQLWQAIQDSWKEDLTAAKLECAFRLLDPVMACIYANNGGNAFKLPHSGIRKQMRVDGWDI